MLFGKLYSIYNKLNFFPLYVLRSIFSVQRDATIWPVCSVTLTSVTAVESATGTWGCNLCLNLFFFLWLPVWSFCGALTSFFTWFCFAGFSGTIHLTSVCLAASIATCLTNPIWDAWLEARCVVSWCICLKYWALHKNSYSDLCY